MTSKSDKLADFAGEFVLTAQTATFDPRTTPRRGDLASIALAGKIFVPHYAVPQPRFLSAPFAMMRAEPSPRAKAVSSLSFGECFMLLDVVGGWGWGYSAHDDYVGYIEMAALGPAPVSAVNAEAEDWRKLDQATHRVSSRSAGIYLTPEATAPVIDAMPMGARVKLSDADETGRFFAFGGGWVFGAAVTPIDAVANDPVAVGMRLLGAPYIWGGRNGYGIDCSGLVQLSFEFCGAALPRDSDIQARQAGEALPPEAKLQRGDIIFFVGHVGMMVDGEMLLHSTGHSMSVVVEPLAEVAARYPVQEYAPDSAHGALASITARRRVKL